MKLTKAFNFFLILCVIVLGIPSNSFAISQPCRNEPPTISRHQVDRTMSATCCSHMAMKQSSMDCCQKHCGQMTVPHSHQKALHSPAHNASHPCFCGRIHAVSMNHAALLSNGLSHGYLLDGFIQGDQNPCLQCQYRRGPPRSNNIRFSSKIESQIHGLRAPPIL